MYRQSFYDLIRPGVQRSAEALVPILASTFKPSIVIDVGCGEGWWGAAFAKHGATAVGVDGAYVTDPVIEFHPHDLAQPFGDFGSFDMAVCLEVAEHLPASRADGFVADLCQLAPVVVFSSAIPGQNGVGHVNEAWPEYWAEKFNANGYSVTGSLRWNIWNDERIERWYRQNLIIATSEPGKYRNLFADKAQPLNVVHPEIFTEHHR